MKRILATLLCIMALPAFVSAQTLLINKVETVKAKVIQVETQTAELVPGTLVKGIKETLKVEILEGSEKGKIVTLSNDYIELHEGETFYLHSEIDAENGYHMYSVSEKYRLPQIGILALLFVALVFIFGGVQGVRGLVSLLGSFVLILYVLLPSILHGYSPILVSVGVAALIIVVGSYVTHGFNRTTTSAVLGMILTVIVTGILAYGSIHYMKFSGYTSEDVVYLNLNSRVPIDVLGLLFGGIMIGLLGVLYDVSISQAISVEELHHIAPHLKRKTIYARAIRIGREHIGALVNTLAIAYVGVALPLLLLFYSSPESWQVILNKEIFSTEIIRILIGSIGLVLAVPITTLLSTFMLVKVAGPVDPETIEKEKRAVLHAGHHH